MGRMGLVARKGWYTVCTDWRTTFVTSPHPQLSVDMQFASVQSMHLVGFNREITRNSIGEAIPRWMGRMGLVARRSLYALCTGWQTTFFASPHPQLSVNMQFALVQALHLVGFSRDLTRICIGGTISRRMGMVGWWPVEVCTLFAPIEGPFL